MLQLKRLLYKCTDVDLISQLSSGASVAAASYIGSTTAGLPLQQDFQGQPLVCEYGKNMVCRTQLVRGYKA